jgi:HKD family nuclease
MIKKLNWLLCFSALLFVFSCNNSIAEEVVDFENNLTNANSNENITFKLLQIYSEPNLDTRARMFDSQKSDDKCFEFVYPISFILPDGSEVTINNDEDWDQIVLWYEENKDAEEEPEIIYPFDVVIDEEVKTITNKKDIEWLEEYCYEKDSEKDYDEKCFEFVYPISFILPDGSEVTINNDEDWNQIDLWYEENKDAEEEPEIIYPFDVVIDEDVKTITNKKDIEWLEEYCYEKDSEKDYDEKCFEFVYPISFILPDGSEVIINTDEDWDQIDLWYEENKDAEEEPEIIYPFDVVIDEDVKTITNKEDFQSLEDYCG